MRKLQAAQAALLERSRGAMPRLLRLAAGMAELAASAPIARQRVNALRAEPGHTLGRNWRRSLVENDVTGPQEPTDVGPVAADGVTGVGGPVSGVQVAANGHPVAEAREPLGPEGARSGAGTGQDLDVGGVVEGGTHD